MVVWKPSPVEVDPDNPFSHDQLHRESHVEDISRLLRRSSESVVMAVDGEWGSGKTTFLRFLDAVLQDRDSPTVFFNAWDVDFVDDPLGALLSELMTAAEEQGFETATEQTLEKVKRFGGALLRRGAPVLIRAASQGLIDPETVGSELADLADEASDEAAAAAEEYIQRYQESKGSLVRFREALGDLVEEIDEHQDYSRPVVFFVDELDRCRPDFAISTLERIKHAFSVEGVSFVLGLNQGELARSVRGAYGSEFGGRRYLDRLIDLRYRLPDSDSSEFIDHMIRESGLAEAVDLRGEQQWVVPSILKNLARLESLPLRLQQKVVARVTLILRITPLRTDLSLAFLTFLVVLRQANPSLYERYVSGSAQAKEVWRYLQRQIDGDLAFDERLGELLRAHLYGNSGDPEEALERHQALDQALRSSMRGHKPQREDIAQELEWLSKHMERDRGELKLLDRRIELARRFHWPGE